MLPALAVLAQTFASRFGSELAASWPLFALVAAVIWWGWPRGGRPARGSSVPLAIFAAFTVLWLLFD